MTKDIYGGEIRDISDFSLEVEGKKGWGRKTVVLSFVILVVLLLIASYMEIPPWAL